MQSERVQNDLGATAGLRYRNGRPRALLRNEYLAAENRILKAQILIRFTECEEYGRARRPPQSHEERAVRPRGLVVRGLVVFGAWWYNRGVPPI